MPTYLITDNQTGTKFKVTGDSPPTDAEMVQIFKDVSSTVKGNPDASPAEVAAMRDKFIADEGTTGTRIKEGIKNVGRAAMPYIRPALEMGGAVGGAVIGGTADIPTGIIPGAAAGGALGYATGKSAADLLERGLGMKEYGTVPQLIAEPIRSTAEGAAMEGGGVVLNKVGGKVWDAGKRLTAGLRNVSPALTKQAVEQKAGTMLTENMGINPQYAANAAEADLLEQELPGYKMSLAERRNDPGLIKLQRGLERAATSETPAANLMAEQKASNLQALNAKLADTFPGENNVADVAARIGATKTEQEAATDYLKTAAATARNELPMQQPQKIGADILTEIETQAAPVKSQMAKMDAALPNQPIEITNLANEAANFANSKEVTLAEKRFIKPVLDDIAARIAGTDGKIGLRELRTVQRNINDTIQRDLDGKASADLLALKDSIQRDLDELSGMISSGRLAEHKGKVVDLDQIAQQYEKNAEELYKLRTPREPDIKTENRHLFEYLAGKGEVVMQNTGVSDAMYKRALQERLNYLEKQGLAADYKPPVGKVDEIRIKDLEAGQENLKRIMADVDPLADAAMQYRAYNNFAHENYFKRFDRGGVSRVTRRGNEASGTQTQLSNIAGQFSHNVDGADDLINAIGQSRAADIMDQHFAHDLMMKANPATGELQANVAQNWLKKNAAVLERYGLTAKYTTVADAQAAVEAARESEKQFAKSAAAKILNSDPEKAIEAAFQTYPKNTGRAAAELRDNMAGDPQALIGLQNAFKDFMIKKAQATVDTIAGDKIIGAASLQKEMDKYLPAMKVLFANEPEKLQALQSVQKAVEISARSSRSPLGGGSDTAENLNAAKSIIGKVLEHIPGIPGVIKFGKIGLDSLQKLNEKEVNQLLARAMYDADLAETLIKAAKGTMKPEVVKTRLNQQLIRMGIMTTKPAWSRN